MEEAHAGRTAVGILARDERHASHGEGVDQDECQQRRPHAPQDEEEDGIHG